MHKWWAWYPVKVLQGKWVWLQYVNREWDSSLNYWGDASGHSGTDGGWKYSLHK